MRSKRHLYEPNHPFQDNPFEAFHSGSWQAVKYLEIDNGKMSMHFLDSSCSQEEKNSFQKLRVKSRRATLTDCTCFLRPGIDVCIFTSPKKASDAEIPEPVWLDGKIISIERKQHVSDCSCQFYIKLYREQGQLGKENVRLGKDIEVVDINRVSILQRFDKHICDDKDYRWSSSEDCTSSLRTKLTLGRFLSDISWLLVASVQKNITFHIRSEHEKIVYQIWEDSDCSLKSAVNVKLEDGVSVSKVFKLASDQGGSTPGGQESLCEESVQLRRSRRRFVVPERFSGCEGVPNLSAGWVRTMPVKRGYWVDKEDTDTYKEEKSEPKSEPQREKKEMNIELSNLFAACASSSNSTVGNTKDLVLYNSKNKNKNVNAGPASHYTSIPEVEAKPLEQDDLNSKYNSVNLVEIKEFSSRPTTEKHYNSSRKKKLDEFGGVDFESTYKGNSSRESTYKGNSSRAHHSVNYKSKDYEELKTYTKTTLSAGAYNELISSYIKNIDCTITQDEPHIVDKWEEIKAATQDKENEQDTSEDEEVSETEMLWKEMAHCMVSTRFLEDDEAKVSNKVPEKTSGTCKHLFRLDEEIGIRCIYCGFLQTEIQYVTAPFISYKTWTAKKDEFSETEADEKSNEIKDLILPDIHTSSEVPSLEDSNNVWALIPDQKNKLHLHQKKAFEFLWRNMAGSLEPALMEPGSEKLGGCVISHSPGAGKTFLIIAFLISYLKLFPGKRPLILAPKTTLYTWYKEFIKWNIPVPVHLIHGRRTYRVFRKKTVKLKGAPSPSHDVMHVLDCLEKVQKWHAQPSVMVMGYTSFLTLMREESKFAHRRYMAKVLRESPGLLVLDEGHNPRSTKSRLRKCLMKVETDQRILLSGTLFQNNFCEYFNTLTLARPKFVSEVLMVLDPKFSKGQGENKARHLLESRARKFFLDNIAKKIDCSKGDERMEGLNMLRNMTTSFIDVYENGNSDTLPGIQIYTLLMNSTEIQHNILVKLQSIMRTYNGYPLELELLITLAAIHPWLIRSSTCVKKFYQETELMELEKLRYDARKGSKVMFVLNLVYRVMRNEKVLIFCHNIAPINLFLDLFENVFQWQRGRELLVLTGDLELFDRGKVMDKFEDPNGPSRVLLASITACAEGISLTAASRVVMLDSEWNPSKTKQAIARAFRPGQRKLVYVYQLLATGTLEEDKYRRTTWKEWVSSMIFSEAFVEDPSRWQTEKIEDDVLREIVQEDKVKSFHMIMKNEKASTG